MAVQLFHQLLLPAAVMAAEVGMVQLLEDEEVLEEVELDTWPDHQRRLPDL